MSDPVEQMVSSRPVVVRRRARWGECDPAGVVYTPRFADYAVAAFDYFVGEMMGHPAQKSLLDKGLGLPMKAMSSEFHRSIWPDQVFEMTVLVGDIRTRSFDLTVSAADQAGRRLFTTTLSPICVDAGERRSVAIPDFLRAGLENYRAICGPPAENGRDGSS